MRIQHNIMAMSAYRNYTNNVSAMKKNLEKLSSGYKINRAGDDAAGLAISEKMRAQITGLETAQKNAKDGISLVQTAEGALTEVHDMLNRMVELATQSANGTYDNTTDRAQMQKEVNQLLDEIDRIADSSNFNGIKLLDGTLGLNQDAFGISAGDDFVAQVDAKTEALAISSFHGATSVTNQAPYFEIDLDNLEFTNNKNTSIASGATFATISINGKSYDLKVATGGTIAKGGKATKDAIGAAIVAAFNTLSKGTSGGGSTAKALGSIGGAGFTAAYSGGKVTFTYQGEITGNKVTASKVDTTGSKMGSTVANAVNTFLGNSAGVTITGATDVTSNGAKQHICDITAPKNAVIKTDGERPGADVDIASVVQNGYKVTIASKSYVFKTGSATVATNGATLIDVSKWADEGATKQAEMAAMMIAGGAQTSASLTGNAAGVAQTAGDFKVSYRGGTKIHVDVVTNKVNDYKTASKIQEKVSFTKPLEAAKAANTDLTIKDVNKITKGDTITITDGSVTTKYVFDKGQSGNGVVYLGTDKTKWTASEVAKAIGTGKTEVNGNVITISAARAAASVAAPIVLGRGLTLQIGDTADSFNQLNVAVQNMHAENLGIGNLSIANEVDAQKAIDKIKAAINTVSDVRGTLGATQNRLDHTINNLSVMTENIQDAESTIRDVDVAEEMMAYTKNNILIQSAQAMLAQANQVPQGVLQLLQ